MAKRFGVFRSRGGVRGKVVEYRLWVRVGRGRGSGVGSLLQRAADEVARAEPDGERQGKYDSSEEYPEGKFDDYATDLQVVEDHRGGEHKDEPF